MEHARSLALLLAAVVVAGATAVSVGSDAAAAPFVPRAQAEGVDPLVGLVQDHELLGRLAARGHSHALFARSPGGVIATAERVARYRPLVERAVAGSGFSADTLEAIVFLESAGRPDAIAGGRDVAAASGLTQILAETGVNFLGMRIDLVQSRRLTRQIVLAEARGQQARVARLEEQRRRVDPRFDPAQALDAAVTYLTKARGFLEREDLAVASYHMGIRNLQNVIRRYAEVAPDAPTAALVRERDLSYAELYFGSAPDRRAAAWRLLAELSDDSRNYYWKVRAARQVMRLYRSDRPRLVALSRLHVNKASAEEVLHPPRRTRQFGTPDEVVEAWREGLLQPLPADPIATGIVRGERMGELAPRLGRQPSLYHGLRPEALAVLLYIGRRVKELSGAEQPLVVTSTVRDQAYQGLLTRTNVHATHGYSLHTTGYAFDLARLYESAGQAAALQFVLERLQAYAVIAWIREPDAIHVTVGPAGRALVPAMLVRRGAPNAPLHAADDEEAEAEGDEAEEAALETAEEAAEAAPGESAPHAWALPLPREEFHGRLLTPPSAPAPSPPPAPAPEPPAAPQPGPWQGYLDLLGALRP